MNVPTRRWSAAPPVAILYGEVVDNPATLDGEDDPVDLANQRTGLPWAGARYTWSRPPTLRLFRIETAFAK